MIGLLTMVHLIFKADCHFVTLILSIFSDDDTEESQNKK